jgi:hypothetical protein
MWSVLIILAGDPMHRVSWHTTHDACMDAKAAQLLHAAITRREVLHVEDCRSHILPPTRPLRRAEVLR